MVWAAGNDGGDGTENVVNPYSQDPTPGVLSVANYDDGDQGSRDNALNSSSSRGLAGDPATYPDLSAPGTNITAACRVYLPVCSTGFDTTDPDYNTISGTSMAAPHIAGYVALLQQAAVAQSGQRLSPGAIEDLLVDTAYQFGSRTYEPDPRNPNSTSGTSFDAGPRPGRRAGGRRAADRPDRDRAAGRHLPDGRSLHRPRGRRHRRARHRDRRPERDRPRRHRGLADHRRRDQRRDLPLEGRRPGRHARAGSRAPASTST